MRKMVPEARNIATYLYAVDFLAFGNETTCKYESGFPITEIGRRVNTVVSQSDTSLQFLILAKEIGDCEGQFAAPATVVIVGRASEAPTGDGERSATDATVGGKIYLIRAGTTGHAHAVNTLFHELLYFGVRR
ncbi:MAG: hypothetical protein V4508_15845 [Pseudomonadota bacterium]